MRSLRILNNFSTLLPSVVFSLLISLLIAAIPVNPACASLLERQTTEGNVLGEEDSQTQTISWKAIPYAKPPVENLRWRSPQPPEQRDEILIADEFCQVCPQYWDNDTNTETPQIITGQEDCLYLNIWAPKNTETKNTKEGLFHRAISQSGVIMPSTPEKGVEHANKVIAKMMVKDNKAADQKAAAALESGKYNKVPMIIGSNKEETKLFNRNRPPFKKWIKDFSFHNDPQKIELYEKVNQYQSDGWKALSNAKDKLPRWTPWTNDKGPKIIHLNADLDNALIKMSDEEISNKTIEASLKKEKLQPEIQPFWDNAPLRRK